MCVLLSFATVIATSLIGGTLDARAQSAYDYPICAIYQDTSSATACYYASYEQCMATMSGIGAMSVVANVVTPKSSEAGAKASNTQRRRVHHDGGDPANSAAFFGFGAASSRRTQP